MSLGAALALSLWCAAASPGGAPPSDAGVAAGVGAAPVTVVAVGDIACDRFSRRLAGSSRDHCQDVLTSELARAQNPAAVLALGDLQYLTGELSEFQAGYEQSFGRLKAITHPAPGNHEYFSGAHGYFTYFGTAAGPPGRGYYSFELGAWHVVSLNSNCRDVSCARGGAQESWLRQDLAAHPKACTLAFFHHPRFSSGPHGDDAHVAPLWQALSDAHADLILSGHDHVYERIGPLRADGTPDLALGIRSFVVGTGGVNLTGFRRGKRGSSEAQLSRTFGVLKLTLSEGGYDWAFLTVQGVQDSGSSSCH